eukprot:766684-Hanusia_phi.AAC.2
MASIHPAAWAGAAASTSVSARESRGGSGLPPRPSHAPRPQDQPVSTAFRNRENLMQLARVTSAGNA